MTILGKTLQFEDAIIVFATLAVVLILFNSFQLSRFVYAYLKRKKRRMQEREKDPDGLQIKEGQEGESPSLNAPKNKVLQFFKGIIIDPIRLSQFQKRIFRSFSIRIKDKHITIPHLALWGFSIILVNTAILFSLSMLFNRYFHRYPQYELIYPKENGVWDDPTKPIEIQFDVAIDYENLIINMSPQIKGKWEFERIAPKLPFSSKMVFYPEETVLPEQKVMIYLTNLSNHLHTYDGGEHLIEFYSVPLPQITKTEPENNEMDVPVNQNLFLELDQEDGPYVDWEVKSNKDITFNLVRNESQKIELAFENTLAQGEKYILNVLQIPLSYKTSNLEVVTRGEKKNVATISFTTVAAPHVKEVSPTGSGILPDTKITIQFKHSMDKASVEKSFSVTPKIEGVLSWEDQDKTLIFTPAQALQKETHYTVTLKKGIQNTAGGITDNKIEFSFDTIGAVAVSGWSPVPYATGVSLSSTLYVTFNQTVDHSSAESRFSISPSVSGNFGWNGNTLSFDPNANLSYNTAYTIVIGAGVESLYGIDSRSSQSSAFTTETQVVTLDVPLYSQTHSKTCNIVATSMALGYKGIYKGEMQVYNEIAKDNTACNYEANTWGNPHVGFVGSIDGSHTCEGEATRGYGVYWEPVSSYLSSNGVSNQIYRSWNIVSLAKEIEKGHPAIVWWQNGWAAPTDVSWTTPGGEYIYAVNGMHSEVVIGFIGSSDNPTHFITNDPWRGRRTLSVGYFDSLWASYFGRTAVVIY